MKHYYNYTDFYKFIENFIELTIFKDLMLKKEKKDILDFYKSFNSKKWELFKSKKV